MPEARHRSARRQGRIGWRTATSSPTSIRGRQEQRKAAAGGIRKEHRKTGARRNLNYQLDFEARERDFGVPGLRRASALSGPGECRRCEWRSLCGRRTSLRANRTDAARWGEYSAIGIQTSISDLYFRPLGGGQALEPDRAKMTRAGWSNLAIYQVAVYRVAISGAIAATS